MSEISESAVLDLILDLREEALKLRVDMAISNNWPHGHEQARLLEVQSFRRMLHEIRGEDDF